MSQTTKIAKRGLGRGISALIPEMDLDLLSGFARGTIAPAPLPASSSRPDGFSSPNPPSQKSAQATSSNWNGESVRYLPLSSVEANPFQPRQLFSEDELEELAASVREHGVLQPVLVRPLGNERYQLIAGERRWRASMRAGLQTLPAIVREVDDQAALELAIIENVQRHDISAWESATAFKRLSSEFGLSQEKIAARVGKSRVSVANTLRLLDLPDEALEAIKSSAITEGHGRALLMATTDDARRALLRRTLRDGLNVREVERLAREANENEGRGGDGGSDVPRSKPKNLGSGDIARIETTLQRALGTRVQIRAKTRGGALVIHYSSPEELLRLTQKLTGNSKEK